MIDCFARISKHCLKPQRVGGQISQIWLCWANKKFLLEKGVEGMGERNISQRAKMNVKIYEILGENSDLDG